MTGSAEEAIAVVGMAGRFPGAQSPSKLWENVLAGSQAVVRRTDASGAVEWARGELDDIAWFDPSFFGMSSRETLALDPQHRIMLECAWEALADAAPGGHAPIRKTAVFAAANYSGYRELLDPAEIGLSAVEFEAGNDKDFLATTIAYRLGLEGPCMSVQTACSSSLVAVHLAAETLLAYDADQALAGGVSIVLPHTPGWRFEPRGIHSPDGVCRPFDEHANGTVMGDGAGIVVLRRLEDAIAAGCRIYAVLRASAVNNDGSRKIGYAAPSVAGQAEVIRAAQARAGVTSGDIGYIETHGTGTKLGDQVEIRALSDVFATDGSRRNRCALGSAKGALGHLDVAAGVVGLIRASLAVHHATLPGTVNHARPHPDLQIEHTPFVIQRTTQLWECEGVRRAGVSSFGVGGTNAHVIIEEYKRGTTLSVAPTQTLLENGYRHRRYWPATKSPAPDAQSSTATPRERVEYLRASWRERAPQNALSEATAYTRTILLSDLDEVATHVQERLRTVGQHVQLANTMATCLDALAQPSTEEHTILMCTWALSAPANDHRAYGLLTTLAAEHADGGQFGRLDVVLATHSVYPVLGDERGEFSRAALSGLARVISMETPSIRIRILDVAELEGSSLDELVREALRWHPEPVLALRGRRWWLPLFDPVAEPVVESFAPDHTSTTGRTCVVIGAGTIGSAATRVLAQAGATVVLAARPGPGAERARALARELQAGGKRVVIEHCDAADPAQLHGLIERSASSYGVLDQVVLAAGISGDAAYQPTAALPRWQDEDHFQVNVNGVAGLAEASRRFRIRRVVLTSSLAGVLGAISLGPYSAAAAAMDCFAGHLDGHTTTWLSVAWDAWRHERSTASAHERAMVEHGLSPAEAETAMARVLTSNESGHLLVVKGDFSSRWDRFVRRPLLPYSAAHDLADVSAEPDIPQLVLEAWRDCLSEPDLGPDDDLLALGADSLNSIDVLASLGERLGVSLPNDLIFQVQTPRLLAASLLQQVTDAPRPRRQLTVRHWHASGPMIWCLHPISGTADCFAPLAQLLDGCQVRAVIGQPLTDVTDEDEGDLPTRAIRYRGLLAAEGPPPAAIVGWSYGGILAFEIAHAVHTASGQHPPVVLLDIPAPTMAGRRSIAEVSDAEIMLAIGNHRARELGQNALNVSQTSISDAHMPHIIDRLRVDNLVPPTFTLDLARRLANGYRRRMRAIENYRPSPYPGQIIVLQAREPEFGDTGILDGVLPVPSGDPSWGWQALAQGACTWQIIDGHHSTMLEPPSVAAVARAVPTGVGTRA